MKRRDQGSSSNSRAQRRMSELTRVALANVQRQRERRRRGRVVSSNTHSYMHDNTSPGYHWLLPGWLAEERTLETGRMYRYYYDPEGNLYRTKHEVLDAWATLAFIVIDD